MSKYTSSKSSKQLYFVPHYDNFISSKRAKLKVGANISTLLRNKSIEDIFDEKQNRKLQNVQNRSMHIQRLKHYTSSNLYNRYEFFPQIFNKNDHKKHQSFQLNINTKNDLILPLRRKNRKQNRNSENSDSFDKNQTSSNRYYPSIFDKLSVLEKYQIKAAEAVSEINFSMLSNIKGHTFQEKQDQNSRIAPKKFKKIKQYECTTEDMKQLEKIPIFLMKLIEPDKPQYLQ